MKGLTTASRIKINAAGDWQIMPPAGQITQIGDAGVTSHALVNNDDLFITGKLEVDGVTQLDEALVVNEIVRFYDTFYMHGDLLYLYGGLYMQLGASMSAIGGGNSRFNTIQKTEEVTIAVGTGAAGVNSVTDLVPSDAVVRGVSVRVTQAPGGGAITFSVGRTGGNIDEFIQNLAVALGTTGTSAADGDGVNAGPVHNAAANTFVITTNANVTGTDMKVRICVYYDYMVVPTG